MEDTASWRCPRFTCSWILQELITPGTVRSSFKLDRDRDKARIAGTNRDTSIPARMVRSVQREHDRAAQKMSWAAKRSTTRLEDDRYLYLNLPGFKPRTGTPTPVPLKILPCVLEAETFVTYVEFLSFSTFARHLRATIDNP